MQSKASTIVILGTGGTIAGTAADASDHLGYTAAQLSIEHLVTAHPALAGESLEAEQVAQIDSKDMDHAIWQRLAQRVARHLERPEVAGIVITHGTDTLEETAYFLHCVLAPARPVVLTGAMRPASALMADGPQNLLDAVLVARSPGARGVLAVLDGLVHGAAEVRKAHPYRLDAFSSGDAGPIAIVEAAMLQRLRDWPCGEPLGVACIERAVEEWPRVELVTSHAGASGDIVRALCMTGVDGLVVAGSGNGTVHHRLHAALLEAQAKGVQVWRSSRCNDGRVSSDPDNALPSAGGLTAIKARVELMLRLLAASEQRP
jgi:L-asparaginase